MSNERSAMKLKELIIFVPDLEKAKAFYSGVLGLAVMEEAEGRVIFALEGVELIAFRCEKEGAVGDYSNEARAAFVFEVESIDATFRDLTARGVRFLHQAPKENWQGRYAAFVDPFGIVHEILESHAP